MKSLTKGTTTTFAFVSVLLAFVSASRAVDPKGPDVPAEYKLLYQQDFTDASALSEFRFSDPSAWDYASDDLGTVLELKKQSTYKPPHRSPFNMALIKDHRFSDFILEVDLLQTGRVYGHQDMCVFYGVNDPAHFYYTHIAVTPDDHANNTFIVNDAPRIKIIEKNPEMGVVWGRNLWHTIRIERRAKEGTIKVFFDDMATPIMSAVDTTFSSGHIGFGSFDDIGKITNIRIWGPSMSHETVGFFKGK